MKQVKDKTVQMALILGVAGLIPFVWAVLALRFGWAMVPGLAARELAMAYGLMIYSFMAGSLWGFAARGGWAVGLVLSVLPVLGFLALVMVGIATVQEALILGFAALLPLDYLFARRGFAPGWWLRLRLGLSAVVLVCLAAIWQMG